MTNLELEKHNRKVYAKRAGMSAAGGALLAIGVILLMQVGYGQGVTGCQGMMSKTFPEEYDSMTKKILENN